jgi:phosphoglycolate phosphatase-like HAD superfamily hydrolase
LIEAVIFDLDRTLIHLPIDYEELFIEFKKIMHTEEVRPLVDTVSKLDPITKGKVFKVWDKAELSVSERITINEEGVRIYEEYSRKPKALVTLQGRKVVEIILERFSLFFDAVVTREDALKRDEQLRIASEKLKTQLQNLLFVGNTDGDYAAARKAGCQFLTVSK